MIVAQTSPDRAMVAQPLQSANAAVRAYVNYCECHSVRLRWLDMRVCPGQNAFVGHGKPDTGHCPLKQLIAPGIVGRFACFSTHLQT